MAAPNISTHAIVLRHVNYRDNDRMLTLFSPALGRIDALARGCRKTRSALSGATELFCAGEYQLYRKGERCTVTGCAIRESYYPLREDYGRLVHGAYLLELCEAMVQPGEEHPALFAHLLDALARLAYGADGPAALTAAALLRFAEVQGYRPSLDRCARCGAALDAEAPAGFDAQAGGALCAACFAGVPRVGKDTLRFLRAAQRLPGEEKLPGAPAGAAEEALRLMRAYMEGRVERAIKAGNFLP